MKPTLIAALAAVTLAGGAQAAPHPPAEPEASIPFPSYGAIRSWRPVDQDTLYVQDRGRQWYRAELFGPCLDLPYALAIGVETRGANRFDRWSTIRVGRDRCQVRSLTLSEAPPADRRRGS